MTKQINRDNTARGGTDVEKSRQKLLVSACLLGRPCRYDGRSKPCAQVIALGERYELVPVCPECDGGLATPRIPSERVGERVVNAVGEDVTDFYRRGAEIALLTCKEQGIERAVLKAKSPSCGRGQIYDGSFSRRLTKGNGFCAELLMNAGITVFTEDEVALLDEPTNE